MNKLLFVYRHDKTKISDQSVSWSDSNPNKQQEIYPIRGERRLQPNKFLRNVHILNITNLCGTRNRVKYGAFATIWTFPAGNILSQREGSSSRVSSAAIHNKQHALSVYRSASHRSALKADRCEYIRLSLSRVYNFPGIMAARCTFQWHGNERIFDYHSLISVWVFFAFLQCVLNKTQAGLIT